MNLRIVGLNHRSASIELREHLTFSPKQIAEALTVWRNTTADTEAVLLSTCNRTEFYVASANDIVLPSTERLLSFLLQQKESPEKGFTLASQVFTLDGLDAVRHLFSVTSGLDSMVLGEVQIFAQVKAAYQTALDYETVGPLTHALFQMAFKTAKDITVETEIHKHRISIPSIAVADFALRIFGRIDDKRILIFGAGEMGRETLRYLVEYGAKSITVLNRHRDRAEHLATEFNGVVGDWKNRFEMMIDADIIVSTVRASEPIVTLNDFRNIEPQRSERILFVLDLAVPRNFEPKIRECPDVHLYSIDDLQEICDKNREERNSEIPKAEKMILLAAKDFVQEMNHRQNGEMIQKLWQRWTLTKDAELHRLFNKLPDLTEKEQAEIRHAFDRLIGKFLHPPLESLRNESKDGVPHKLLDALARLFHLRDNN
ncbi:MAG: glutamyl-tRNA reductase [Planctomycetaceae bacterium]|jgi:glutamyl-tRNA reductase|nr:glutamyl-tRNA reductase [Planctomycetaceae bacterium]